MKLEITNFFNDHGKEFFKYELLDGPNDEEKVQGYASDLIVAFTKVLEWRERISRDYDLVDKSEEDEVNPWTATDRELLKFPKTPGIFKGVWLQ